MKPYYQHDGITLYLGDCREVTEWLAEDVLVTDPPYGIGWRVGEFKASVTGKRKSSSAAHAGIENDRDTTLRDGALTAWGEKPWVSFGSWKAPFPRGSKQVLVWRKPYSTGMIGATLGFKRDTELIFVGGTWPNRPANRSSVLTTNGHHNDYHAGHPHSKPVPLLASLLETCPPGTIADPFAGSGSTLVAAKLQGRSAIGVEIEEKYAEICARRLDQGVLDFGEATHANQD